MAPVAGLLQPRQGSEGLGDDARARVIFGESIVAFQRLDDPYDLAEVIEDIAVIAAASQPAIGLELLGGADRMRADIGAARPAARESELVADLAEARATLGAAADATIEVGRARAATETIGLALEVCAVP